MFVKRGGGGGFAAGVADREVSHGHDPADEIDVPGFDDELARRDIVQGQRNVLEATRSATATPLIIALDPVGSQRHPTCSAQIAIARAAPLYVSIPAISSPGGFRTPAPGLSVRRTVCHGPASENLHKSGHWVTSLSEP
jgi:hypothetical protein